MKQENYSIERIEIIQSYILTTARYKFNVHEKRIMYRLVEMIQFQLAGKKLNQRYSVQKDFFDLYHVEIPLRAFLHNEHDTNHIRAKTALTRLTEKVLYYEDENEWKAIPLIILPRIKKHEGTCTFRLHEDIYDALLNFSKGYKKYELKTAMQFESVYAMRLYELLSKQKTPLTYSIEQLKAMFGIEDKYNRPPDFIKRVIDTAKKELDAKSPYSFEYKPLKTGKQITSIKFYPTYIAKNETDEEHIKSQKRELIRRKDFHPGAHIDRAITNYLKDFYGFSDREIKNNFELFKEAQKERPDLLLFMSHVKAKANRAANPKGYIINAIKKKIKQEKATGETEKKISIE
jgi:plasmid replication initiation protein